MLEVLSFLCQYELLSWIFRIWISIPQLRRFTLKLCQSITPHQKFSFYHLPTWGRAGIKLGDAWYVSNVSIIFYCSMLLYFLFWMFNGLYYALYIIFGTNLLTGGPVKIAVFCLFQCFAEKEYQTESKWNKTFAMIFLGPEDTRRTWRWSQKSPEEATSLQGAT